jgi:hypothetical protein
MELALVLRELARRRWMVALGVAVAATAAVLSVYRLEGTKLEPRSLQHASAHTQVIVDSQPSVLGSVSQSFEPLASRAVVYSNFMTSPVVLGLIGRQVGLSGEQIYAAGPVSANEPRVEQEPTALRRNVEITGEPDPYRLNFESQGNLPTISINSQAPTTNKAVALANAAAVAMQRYVQGIETAGRIAPSSRVVIRQLGPATGGVVGAGIRKSLAVMVFLVVFLLWCVLVLVASRFREAWRASAAPRGVAGDEGSEDGEGGDESVEATRPVIETDVPESPTFDVWPPRDHERDAEPVRSVR